MGTNIDYGVTLYGFNKKRKDEIIKEFKENLLQNLKEKGLNIDIDVTETNLIGLIISATADLYADIWEKMLSIYLSSYPNTATGISLDNAAGFTGVTRRGEVPPQALVEVDGDGYTINNKTLLKNSKTNAEWIFTDKNVTVRGLFNTVGVVVEYKNATVYKFILDNKEYSHKTDNDFGNIKTLLKDIDKLILKDVYSTETRVLEKNIGEIIIRKVSSEKIAFKPLLNTTISKSLNYFTATTSIMEDIAEVGDLTLQDSIPGIKNATNVEKSTEYRPPESDAELRERYIYGVFRTGAATLPSLEPNMMMNVPGVIDARVQENSSDKVVDGLLPHSVRFIVYGGSDNNIAEEIHLRKGAGIDTNGKVSVKLSKDYGDFIVKFDRPRVLYLWIKLDVKLTSSVTSIDVDTIKEDITKKGNSFKIGKDIPVDTFLCLVFKHSEVYNADIQYAITNMEADTPKEWKKGLIDLEDDQIALFSYDRVIVEIN